MVITTKIANATIHKPQKDTIKPLFEQGSVGIIVIPCASNTGSKIISNDFITKKFAINQSLSIL